MLVAVFVLVILTVFVSSSDLKVYGYVFNVNGNRISTDSYNLYGRRQFITSSVINISNYHDSFNESSALYEMIAYYHNYLLSFKYELKNIDNKNATKFISLYEDYYSFDPLVISQNVNHKSQQASLYYVITGIEIICDINMNKNDFKYVQINQICGGNVSSGRRYLANNESFFAMRNYNDDETIINFFATGNSFIHYTRSDEVTGSFKYIETGGKSLQEVQYDVFYPGREWAGTNCRNLIDYEQISNISDADKVIIVWKYNECNSQIIYDNPWNCKSDIEQTGFFDIDLMNEKYKNVTNDGSFMYYGVGGVCSGIFCDMEGINWIVPNITTYSPTSKPTNYPTENALFPSIDYTYDGVDRKWWILSLIFINLFVLSSVFLCGVIIYLWNKNRTLQKGQKSAVYEQVKIPNEDTAVCTAIN